jgi:hypothetical protein
MTARFSHNKRIMPATAKSWRKTDQTCSAQVRLKIVPPMKSRVNARMKIYRRRVPMVCAARHWVKCSRDENRHAPTIPGFQVNP